MTDDEKYNIYEYCVKNQCIVQHGPLIRFRMLKNVVLEEINKTDLFPTRKVSTYHLDAALRDVIEWQSRLGIEIETKETAEVEQIREQHIRDRKQIEELKLQVKNLTESLIEFRAVENNINDLKQRLANIRKQATI